MKLIPVNSVQIKKRLTTIFTVIKIRTNLKTNIMLMTKKLAVLNAVKRGKDVAVIFPTEAFSEQHLIGFSSKLF